MFSKCPFIGRKEKKGGKFRYFKNEKWVASLFLKPRRICKGGGKGRGYDKRTFVNRFRTKKKNLTNFKPKLHNLSRGSLGGKGGGKRI